MAIVQISKIIHRTGSAIELPQLDVGEIGFASDEQRVFIGNDPEWVPPVGIEPTVTEILTNSPNCEIDCSQLVGIYQATTNSIRITGGNTGDVLTTNGAGILSWSQQPSVAGFATETYVDTAITNLVDSAPGALNTLNELSAALNDDSNFASTVATGLAAKATTTYVDTELAAKADTSYVDSELASKATTTYVNTELAAKADTSYVDTGLAAKADSADLSAVALSGSYADLSNTPTLGTAASTDATAYATAAQGTKADSAIQPENLATVATSGEYFDLINLPSIPLDVSDLTDSTNVLDAYVPSNIGDWDGTPPSTVTEALDRLAALIKILNSGTGA